MGAAAGGWRGWDWLEITDIGGSGRGIGREKEEGIVGYARVKVAMSTPSFL